MQINGTEIVDTYAEAFPIWLSRVIITADTHELAMVAATEATGFATSTIMCPCASCIGMPAPIAASIGSLTT